MAQFVLGLAFSFLASAAFGQTSYDFAAKYKPLSFFEVRPGILMTVRYSRDGQACELALEKTHVSPTEIELSPTIPDDLADELIDELAPEAERGERIGLKWLDETIAGSVIETTRDFENLTIRMVGSLTGVTGYQVIVINWKQRECAEQTAR